MANGTVERLIGIDFGTSTSLVKVKRYRDGAPVGDSYHTDSVTYGNGDDDTKAMTLVRINPDGSATCGRYGEEVIPGAQVYREFKMDLESPDERKQALAKELTAAFLSYLYQRYAHQQSDLGQSTDEVRTLISYPAKWTEQTRRYMIEAMEEAGFPNVSSMDEPSTALYAVLCRKMNEISAQGLLRIGEPGYALLIDMGAGTTDLAVCRYMVDGEPGSVITSEQVRSEIIATWPGADSHLTFGGREVDRILEEYVIEYLCDCGSSREIAERVTKNGRNVKNWKETVVSGNLNRNQPVNTCGFVAGFLPFLSDYKPFPAFDREKFQQMLGSRLEDFREIVRGCLEKALADEPEIREKHFDLVILTGGHSSWYFAEELLSGTMPGLEHPALTRVQQEKHRVVRLSNPQETVALGLVYSRLPFHVAEEKREEVQESETGRIPQSVGEEAVSPDPGYARRVYDFLQNADKNLLAQLTVKANVEALRRNLAVPAGETVLLVSDATIFKTGRNGTVFTNRGIYSRGLWSMPGSCTWEEFARGELSKSDGGLTFYLRKTAGVPGLASVGYFSPNQEAAFRLYLQLQSALRSGAEQPHAVPAPAEEHPPVQAQEPPVLSPDMSWMPDLTGCLQAFLSSYDPNVLRGLFEVTNHMKMMRHFAIPANEIVYLAHDDTLFKNGRNGTMITNAAVYTRDIFGTQSRCQWEEFVGGVITYSGSDVFCNLGANGSRKQIGYFTGMTPMAADFFLRLQEAMRRFIQSSMGTAQTGQ